ncbi:YybH family protein [Sphingomonas bisphenolicum]
MTARLALLALGAAALVAAPSAAKPPPRFQPDPSSVIAAEIAFNRLAQSKGQWTAFDETAADDAVMFVPQKVVAKDWLKKQANPAASVRWSTSVVYVSCDGNLAASTGNWTRPDGSVGYYTTIWRRDRKGRWQWIMDHGDTLATARATPEFLSGKVATCRRGPQGAMPPPPPSGKKGELPPPPDESLIWTADVATDGSRQVTVRMWTGGAYETVIDDRIKAGS